MTTPMRSELLSALAAHSAAEGAWRDLINRMRDRKALEPGSCVALNAECRRAWQVLLDLADRLPDQRNQRIERHGAATKEERQK